MAKTQTRWIVYNPETLQKIKTVTINHKSNLLYIELNEFDKKLKEQGLTAHSYEAVNQPHLSGKTFAQRIKILS